MTKLSAVSAGGRGLRSWMVDARKRIDAALPRMLPQRHRLAGAVHEAMAYALLSPGKRVRPMLMLAVGEAYRVERDRLLPFACAIEMVHASSLILDDLPCMDDAATRRGKPSCHVAFGEATTILAAIGLLDLAFLVLAGDGERDAIKTRPRAVVLQRIAASIGTDGVIGGQMADLDLARRRADGSRVPIDLETLEYIHSHKTGSLFIAAAEVGAHVARATAAEVRALGVFAKNLGLAFQITDDLIDRTGDAGTAGKPVGADSARVTFVDLCGVEGARALVEELTDTAIEALAPFGRRAARLESLARFLATRDR
ncbi:MAG: polyprenyl synthetase family protein [Acidobacteriota bacterium]